MHCPFCSADETRVVDSRFVSGGGQVRRRRECVSCSERFTTYEEAELIMPRIVKQDDRIEIFDESKLRAGLLRAVKKRPVTSEEIEIAVNRIKKKLRTSGERELRSHFVGEAVMEALLVLDDVAYIRFASVYKQFHDLHAFRSAIDALMSSKTRIKETE